MIFRIFIIIAIVKCFRLRRKMLQSEGFLIFFLNILLLVGLIYIVFRLQHEPNAICQSESAEELSGTKAPGKTTIVQLLAH